MVWHEDVSDEMRGGDMTWERLKLMKSLARLRLDIWNAAVATMALSNEFEID